jgi:hypothetical protein
MCFLLVQVRRRLHRAQAHRAGSVFMAVYPDAFLQYIMLSKRFQVAAAGIL